MDEITHKTRWWLLAALASSALACIAGWMAANRATVQSGPPSNAIMVIAPYWYNGTWVLE